MRIAIGGYSNQIVLGTLDARSGAVAATETLAGPENASFLLYDERRRMLYGTVETGYGAGESGAIAAFRISRSGLAAAGSLASCGGAPCHLALDAVHDVLVAANYGGESTGVLGLDAKGVPARLIQCLKHAGSSVNPKRQQEPHPHCGTFSADGRFLHVCDLGIDRIVHYRVDPPVSGFCVRAGETAVAPGSGPRHLLVTADGRHAYLVNELANTVVAYVCREDGTLAEINSATTLPPDYGGRNSSAEIQLHPSGRYLYTSNRGHDSIAVFRRDEASGAVEHAGTFPAGGKTPRHFCLDPAGRFFIVALQGSDLVLTFSMDSETGHGTPTGHSLTVPKPTCTVFL